MACRTVDAGEGRVLILCSRRHARTSRCQFCGLMATRLCDAKIGPQRTCDAKLCARCARVSGGSDFCPKHGQQGLL